MPDTVTSCTILYGDLSHLGLLRVLMKRLLRSQFCSQQILLLIGWRMAWLTRLSDVIYKELVWQRLYHMPKLSDAERMSFKMNFLPFLSSAVAALTHAIFSTILCLVLSNVAYTPILSWESHAWVSTEYYRLNEKRYITAVAADQYKILYKGIYAPCCKVLRVFPQFWWVGRILRWHHWSGHIILSLTLLHLAWAECPFS